MNRWLFVYVLCFPSEAAVDRANEKKAKESERKEPPFNKGKKRHNYHSLILSRAAAGADLRAFGSSPLLRSLAHVHP